MTTDVFKIEESTFNKATINLYQARSMLNMLAENGDNREGFSDHADALQVIYASQQMVGEALEILDTASGVVKND